MSNIHPMAVVAPGAELGADVTIGPFCCVGENVRLGDGVTLVSHVVVQGHTSDRRGHCGCSPSPPRAAAAAPALQGRARHARDRRNNQIREHVTMHPGTPFGSGATRIGDNGLFMVGTHVAHDCEIANHVIMANNATLGGHVHVDDHAYLGGLCAVHQFVRIGHHAMIGGMSGVESDVIPYGSVMGDRGRLSGLNVVGLKRHGFSREDVHRLRSAYRLLFAQEGTLAERIVDVAELFSDHPPVMDIVNFIREDSTRSICQPRANGG
jgi:UDP-N-acetylglucosamine acyltransferase